MRMRLGSAGLLVGALLLTGCLDVDIGSRLTFNLIGFDSPCEVLRRNSATVAASIQDWPQQCTGDKQDDRLVHHYEIWGTLRSSGAVHLQSFTVQQHLFAAEQKQWELDGKRLANGELFKIGRQKAYKDMTEEEQAEADRKLKVAEGLVSITSFATEEFEADGVTFTEDFFVGRHDQATYPHNGEFYGTVERTYPKGSITVGGAAVTVPEVLDDLNSLMITLEPGAPDREPRQPTGLVVVRGQVVQGADRLRGIEQVKASGVFDETLQADFAVLTDMEDDSLF